MSIARATTRLKQLSQTVLSALTAFWRWLTEPSETVPDSQRRAVRLLSSLLIALMPIGTIGYFSAVLFDPTFSFQPISAGGIAFLWTAYFLSRSPYFRVAIVLIVLGSAAPVYGLILTNNADHQMLPFLLVTMILASILLSTRAVIGLIIVNVLSIVALGVLAGTWITFGLLFYTTTSLLLLVFSRHRDLLEADRQAALTSAKEQLEIRVQERTAELSEANRQLKVEIAQREQAEKAAALARDQALEASRLKSQFLANMSHELRTPLNAVLNFSEFVAAGTLGSVSPQQVDALQKVIASGDYLLSLINDILDLTKIEAGLVELFVEEVNLQAVLDSAVDTAKALVKGKPIQLIMTVEGSLPTISGDKRRIRQILLNLISNAIKFTEEGNITLQVSVTDVEVIFAVKDTGPGIPLEDQKIILEAFRQGRQGLKQTSGTGLGLPISKHLAEAHKGRLWFESTVGSGSTFYVALPVDTQAPPAITEVASKPEEASDGRTTAQ